MGHGARHLTALSHLRPPLLPSRADVFPAGSQDAVEHSDCQGKQQGQGPLELWLYMALKAVRHHGGGGRCSVLWHSHITPFSSLWSLSLPPNFTPSPFFIDGATGSQSGTGDPAYGESTCSHPVLPARPPRP